MTEEQKKRVDFYLAAYEEGKAKLQDNLEEWEEIHRAYKGERTDATEGGKINPVAVNIILSQGRRASIIANE